MDLRVCSAFGRRDGARTFVDLRVFSACGRYDAAPPLSRSHCGVRAAAGRPSIAINRTNPRIARHGRHDAAPTFALRGKGGSMPLLHFMDLGVFFGERAASSPVLLWLARTVAGALEGLWTMLHLAGNMCSADR